jgi:hypothetical protein
LPAKADNIAIWMHFPKVHIIILNWNGKADTLECLASVRAIDYPNYEIVVVDNGSFDGSEEAIRAAFPKVTFIQTCENLGYAGGNNVGIRYGLNDGAEYVWLLNNDTVVDGEVLSALVEVAQADERIGMVGSKIYYHAQPDVIWYAGATLDLENGAKTAHVGSGEKEVGQFEAVQDVGYVTGCSLLVKREVIDRIGLIPEVYFLYFEETEWNLLAQRAGYRTVIAPKSKLWHKVSADVQIKPTFLYYMTRNRFLFVKRNNKQSIKSCVNLQYARGKLLFMSLWHNGDRLKSIEMLSLIARAWIDGLVFGRTGKSI